VATQSLMLMNSDFILQQAGYFAARVRKEAPSDPANQVLAAWQLAFARAPQPEELSRALAFLAEQAGGSAGPAVARTGTAPNTAGAPPASAAPEGPVDALVSLCQILLSTNEFLYVE